MREPLQPDQKLYPQLKWTAEKRLPGGAVSSCSVSLRFPFTIVEELDTNLNGVKDMVSSSALSSKESLSFYGGRDGSSLSGGGQRSRALKHNHQTMANCLPVGIKSLLLAGRDSGWCQSRTDPAGVAAQHQPRPLPKERSHSCATKTSTTVSFASEPGETRTENDVVLTRLHPVVCGIMWCHHVMHNPFLTKLHWDEKWGPKQTMLLQICLNIIKIKKTPLSTLS